VERTTKYLPWAQAALVLLLLSLSPTASAQGCALCYTQAASAGHRIIEALRSGILILIFPPMAICIGLTIIAYKKRDSSQQEPGSARPHDRGSGLGW